uniref:Fibrinogen C-terminal domain-containing protein n=1 Tax=Cyprinus carpio carpio TaxID=630221 RepID=A0A9J7ZT74_CYPCA
NIFDKSFYQLSVLASEIKEEGEELKKTTVILKANNEEIKSLSLEINSKVEDIIEERISLRRQVGGLEEKLSGLSQSLLSAEQLAEIFMLKEIILTQEKCITDLLKAVSEQSDQRPGKQSIVLRNLLRSNTKNAKNFRCRMLIGLTQSDIITSLFTWCNLPKDCSEVFSRGQKSSGLYAIKPLLVNCEFIEMDVFTVIQRRRDSSVNFDLSWEKYEDGFWLGLNKIYAVARQGNSLLHVQIEDWRKEKHFMLYQYILGDAASNYTILLKLQSGESSSAVDENTSFGFSTKDHNDGSKLCPRLYRYI